jgi:hypothetical protein
MNREFDKIYLIRFIVESFFLPVIKMQMWLKLARGNIVEIKSGVITANEQSAISW